MNDKSVPSEPIRVGCEVCLKEIPQSVAMTEEGKDYVHYFCGLECYTSWKKKDEKPAAAD